MATLGRGQANVDSTSMAEWMGWKRSRLDGIILLAIGKAQHSCGGFEAIEKDKIWASL